MSYSSGDNFYVPQSLHSLFERSDCDLSKIYKDVIRFPQMILCGGFPGLIRDDLQHYGPQPVNYNASQKKDYYLNITTFAYQKILSHWHHSEDHFKLCKGIAKFISRDNIEKIPFLIDELNPHHKTERNNVLSFLSIVRDDLKFNKFTKENKFTDVDFFMFNTNGIYEQKTPLLSCENIDNDNYIYTCFGSCKKEMSLIIKTQAISSLLNSCDHFSSENHMKFKINTKERMNYIKFYIDDTTDELHLKNKKTNEELTNGNKPEHLNWPQLYITCNKLKKQNFNVLLNLSKDDIELKNSIERLSLAVTAISNDISGYSPTITATIDEYTR